jgi:hypothetical protein
MNSPTAGVSAAVVIAKNPSKGQFLEHGIPLGIILPADIEQVLNESKPFLLP